MNKLLKVEPLDTAVEVTQENQAPQGRCTELQERILETGKIVDGFEGTVNQAMEELRKRRNLSRPRSRRFWRRKFSWQQTCTTRRSHSSTSSSRQRNRRRWSKATTRMKSRRGSALKITQRGSGRRARSTRCWKPRGRRSFRRQTRRLPRSGTRPLRTPWRCRWSWGRSRCESTRWRRWLSRRLKRRMSWPGSGMTSFPRWRESDLAALPVLPSLRGCVCVCLSV